MNQEKEKTLISIVEEIKKEGEITSSRMLTIYNIVRKSMGINPLKVCPTSKQKIVGIVRKVLGENLNEEAVYASYGEGRKPTRFSITDCEKALKDIEVYFSKKKSKAIKSSTEQKRVAISKLITILEKASMSSDMIKTDMLKELIDAKTPISGTLRNWSSMLEKEGVKLIIKSTGKGIYKIENLQDTKEKLEEAYGKLSEEYEGKKKTTKPITLSEDKFKELTSEEERIIYLLAKICEKKEVPYHRIWTELKRQGITAGFDFNKLIKRSGLNKWFEQVKKVVAGGVENQIKFTGDLTAVASLMGQEVEKTMLVRSSLEPSEMKSIIKNNTVILKCPMPNANIYSIGYSGKSKLSQLDLLKLKLSFRGYDGFIEDSDEEFVDTIVNTLFDEMSKSYELESTD